MQNCRSCWVLEVKSSIAKHHRRFLTLLFLFFHSKKIYISLLKIVCLLYKGENMPQCAGCNFTLIVLWRPLLLSCEPRMPPFSFEIRTRLNSEWILKSWRCCWSHWQQAPPAHRSQTVTVHENLLETSEHIVYSITLEADSVHVQETITSESACLHHLALWAHNWTTKNKNSKLILSRALELHRDITCTGLLFQAPQLQVGPNLGCVSDEQ